MWRKNIGSIGRDRDKYINRYRDRVALHCDTLRDRERDRIKSRGRVKDRDKKCVTDRNKIHKKVMLNVILTNGNSYEPIYLLQPNIRKKFNSNSSKVVK